MFLELKAANESAAGSSLKAIFSALRARSNLSLGAATSCAADAEMAARDDVGAGSGPERGDGSSKAELGEAAMALDSGRLARLIAAANSIVRQTGHIVEVRVRPLTEVELAKLGAARETTENEPAVRPSLKAIFSALRARSNLSLGAATACAWDAEMAARDDAGAGSGPERGDGSSKAELGEAAMALDSGRLDRLIAAANSIARQTGHIVEVRVRPLTGVELARLGGVTGCMLRSLSTDGLNAWADEVLRMQRERFCEGERRWHQRGRAGTRRADEDAR